MKDVRNKIGNYNPNFIMGVQSALTYKGFALNFTIDWRNGGQFISQTERTMNEAVNSQRWLDNLINPGNRTGQELRDWLVANQETLIKNGFHTVGGPTKEYGGFLESVGPVPLHDGVFVPGVFEEVDAEGKVTYIENLGGPDTKYYPYILSNAWGFAKPAMLDADFVKLREISLSYQLPKNIVNRIGAIHNISFSVYSRNIMLWTKAKTGIDPERAFQAESSTEGRRGTQFKQGIERFNLDPWVIPIGFKIDMIF
jgi:hypothetical protein